MYIYTYNVDNIDSYFIHNNNIFNIRRKPLINYNSSTDDRYSMNWKIVNVVKTEIYSKLKFFLINLSLMSSK